MQIQTTGTGGETTLLVESDTDTLRTTDDGCCCGDQCCDGEVISRYEREGASPSTTAECATVMRVEITAESGGCVNVGDWILMYEDSPFIWSNRPDEPLNQVGFLTAACSESTGFGNAITGCPSSGNEGVVLVQECNPYRLVVRYTVGNFDLICFGCPMNGGWFELTFTLERIYGDPC